jgi:hypothetical protein
VSFEVEFRPEAFADVAEAFASYEAQHSGLGREFEAELDDAQARARGFAKPFLGAERAFYYNEYYVKEFPPGSREPGQYRR